MALVDYLICAAIFSAVMPWIFPKLFGLPGWDEPVPPPEKPDLKVLGFDWPAEWAKPPAPASPMTLIYRTVILLALAALMIQVVIAFPQLAAWGGG